MARILKWQEKLVLACAALFFSMASAWGLGPRGSATSQPPSSSRVVTLAGRKSTAGIELMARRPYVRLIRASLAPVSLPLAAGAYVAIAGAAGAAARPAAEGTTAATDEAGAALGECGTCTTGCKTNPECWTEVCTEHGDGSYTCVTCDQGTCVCT